MTPTPQPLRPATHTMDDLERIAFETGLPIIAHGDMWVLAVEINGRMERCTAHRPQIGGAA